MKAINYTYELENERIRVYAVPSQEGYRLDFITKEEAPAGSKEIFSTLPFNAAYGVSSLLEGIIVEPLMMSQLDSCKLIKDEEGFKECEMQILTTGTVGMNIVQGDFSPIENITLSSAQKQDMLAYLGYDKIREVNEWFEECKKRLCVRAN